MTSATGLNPYIVGSAVSGERFYGRDDILDFIRGALKAVDNHIVLLHGQRRIGKSSILQHLQEKILPEEGYLAVYVDLQPVAQAGLDQILDHIAEPIAAAAGVPHRSSIAPGNYPDHFITSFIPQVLAKLNGQRLVVLVDEFDTLAELGEGGESPQANVTRLLLDILGHLSEEYETSLSFILAVARQYQHLPADMKMWLREFRAREVWLLDERSARELIVKPAAGQLTYQPGAIKKILALTAGHPLFIQLLCFEAFSRLQGEQRKEVTPGDVEAVVPGALAAGSGYIAWIWDSLSLSGKLTLSAFSEAVDRNGLATPERIRQVLEQHRVKLGSGIDPVKAVARLCEEKILSLESHNSYKFQVEMARRWVHGEHPIHREKQFIETLSRPAIGYYETATGKRADGKLDEAIASYREALRHNPNHLGAQLGLAQALQENSDLASAVEAFEEAYWLDPISSRPGLIDALLALADQAQCQGELPEAVTRYRRILDLDPKNPILADRLQAWLSDARRAIEAGKWDKANSYLDCITHLNPNYEKKEIAHLIGLIRPPSPRPRRDVPLPRLWPVLSIVGVIILIGIGIAIGVVSIRPASTVTPTQAVLAPPTPTSTPILVAVTATPSATTGSQPPPVTPTITATPKPGETPRATDTPTATPTPYVIFVTATPTEAPTATPTPTPTPTPASLGPSTVLALDASADGQTLFAAVRDKGIWRSTDGGLNWAHVWPSGATAVDQNTFNAVAVAPGDPRTVYVGGWNVVLRSTDGGGTWQELSPMAGNGLPMNQQIFALAVSPADARLVFAGASRGIFKSADGGDSWQSRTQAVNGEQLFRPFYTIAIARSDANRVYAVGESNIVYWSTDAGSSDWQSAPCQPCGGIIYALAVDANNPQHVVVGGCDGVIAMSNDGGRSWRGPLGSINRGGASPTLNFSALAFGPGGALYAGTGFRSEFDGFGVFRSGDGGDSWSPFNDGLGTGWVQAVVAGDGSVLAAGASGVFKLVDNHWEAR